MDIDRVIEIVRQHKLQEMMTVGGGNLAGLPPDEPPVNPKKKNCKKKYIGLGCGSRKRWMA